MRRLLLPAVAFAVLVGGVWTATALGSATDGRGAFADDDGIVHESNVNALGASGITTGCNPPANDRYCPGDPVTRAQMATFLVRALGIPSGESTFIDTSASVHRHNIDALSAAGITTGCNPPANDRYCPDDPVTRAQMATFLVNALDLPLAGTTQFTDTSASVHRDNIEALAAAGVTFGCNPPVNDRYCPGEAVTRAQMASFLVRALDLDPILNRLSLRTGISCGKDGTACSGRRTLAGGTDLVVREGWYQVLPYRPGEETQFTSTDTNVTFTWDGAPLSAASLGVGEVDGRAERMWQVTPPRLVSGSHTLRASWHWNDSVTQTVTVTISVP